MKFQSLERNQVCQISVEGLIFLGSVLLPWTKIGCFSQDLVILKYLPSYLTYHKSIPSRPPRFLARRRSQYCANFLTFPRVAEAVGSGVPDLSENNSTPKVLIKKDIYFLNTEVIWLAICQYISIGSWSDLIYGHSHMSPFDSPSP